MTIETGYSIPPEITDRVSALPDARSRALTAQGLTMRAQGHGLQRDAALQKVEGHSFPLISSIKALHHDTAGLALQYRAFRALGLTRREAASVVTQPMRQDRRRVNAGRL